MQVRSVHSLQGMLRDCYSNVTVTSTGGTVGGLIGRFSGGMSNTGIVERCHSACVVRQTTTHYCGGLIGMADRGIVSNNYATGDVRGHSFRTASFIGQVSSTAFIVNCYTTALSNGGGLFRSQSTTATILRTYFDTQTSGVSSGLGAQTTAALQRPTSATGIYTNWDPDVWDFGTSSQYPVLKVAFNQDNDTTTTQ